MTRRERLEKRMEQRKEWAEKAHQRSAAAMEKADKIVEHIPMGQPILVGHHSEAMARREHAKIERNMDKCVEEYRLAEHHEEKAEGLANYLDKTIFSDDPDAIERLREKLAGMEAAQERMKAINKIIRGAKKSPAAEIEKQIIEAFPELKPETVAELVTPPDYIAYQGPGFPSYMLSNNNANIVRIRKRIADIEKRNERQAAAESAPGGILIEGKDYVRITFCEKPAREIINELRAAGFYWCRGGWSGTRKAIPESVLQMADVPEQVEG